MLKERPLPEMKYIVEMQFNEDKIARESKHSYKAIVDSVIRTFREDGFKSMFYNGKLLIYDNRTDEDYFAFILSIAINLYDCEWLNGFLLEYNFYDYYSYDEDGFYETENLLESIPIAKKRWA